MESRRKRILIIGGYGMVGSNIARLIRIADNSSSRGLEASHDLYIDMEGVLL